MSNLGDWRTEKSSSTTNTAGMASDMLVSPRLRPGVGRLLTCSTTPHQHRGILPPRRFECHHIFPLHTSAHHSAKLRDSDNSVPRTKVPCLTALLASS